MSRRYTHVILGASNQTSQAISKVTLVSAAPLRVPLPVKVRKPIRIYLEFELMPILTSVFIQTESNLTFV